MAVMGAGRHAASVVSHVLGKSGTGTHHVAVLFEDAHGDRIMWYGYLSDAALERTIASLVVLGWDPAAYDGRVDSLNGTDLLVDAQAELVVEMEVYEGQARSKVKWVNAAGGGAEAMEEMDAAAFAASLRGKILTAHRPKATSQPGPARAAHSRPQAAVPRAAVPTPAGRTPEDDFDDSLPF